MNKQERIEELKKEIEELKEQLNDRGRDFYNDYDILNINYLDDAFHEFADSNVDIYYSDLLNYCKENPEECLRVLIDLGYELKDFSDVEDLIYKGAQAAQYEEIINELAENEDIFEEIREKLVEIEELENEE